MLYEVTLSGRYRNQLIVNRWNYNSDDGPVSITPSLALAQAMGFTIDQTPPVTANVFGSILNMLSATMTYNEVAIRAIYDVEDFYALAFVPPVPGNFAATDTVSPVTAIGFRTSRVRQDIRRGTKRFAGVNESAIQEGGVLTSAALTAANLVATRMNQPLVVSGGEDNITFQPVVVSKEKVNIAEPGQPPRYSYRYYETLSEQLEHIASGIIWEPYAETRSQTSRQYGRGA